MVEGYVKLCQLLQLFWDAAACALLDLAVIDTGMLIPQLTCMPAYSQLMSIPKHRGNDLSQTVEVSRFTYFVDSLNDSWAHLGR